MGIKGPTTQKLVLRNKYDNVCKKLSKMPGKRQKKVAHIVTIHYSLKN